MVVREKFEADLLSIRNMVLDLGRLAEQALQKSFQAFVTNDNEAALQVLEDDTHANMLEEQINDFAILLITKQQPMAIDSRRIIGAIKIASDLERMCDYGVNIAKATIRLRGQQYTTSIGHLKVIHEHMLAMLKLALEAYSVENIQMVKDVAAMDDKIDEVYGQFMKQLIRHSNEELNQVTQVSSVARQIERSADHITNITENIYYIVRGRHLDLNK